MTLSLILWLAPAVINFALLLYITEQSMKRSTKSHIKRSESSNIISGIIKIAIMCLMPVLNWLVTFILLYDTENVIESTVKDINDDDDFY